MKYLMFAVFADAISGNILTHSKEVDLDNTQSDVDCREAAIASAVETGMKRQFLQELFLFENGTEYPIISEHWILEDYEEEEVSDEDFLNEEE